jgi:predicted transcriptional regulator
VDVAALDVLDADAARHDAPLSAVTQCVMLCWKGGRAMSSVTRSIRIDAEVLHTFERLAEATGRSTNFLMADALTQYAAEKAYLAEAVEEGLRDLREGRVLSAAESRVAIERLTSPEARQQAKERAQKDQTRWSGD